MRGKLLACAAVRAHMGLCQVIGRKHFVTGGQLDSNFDFCLALNGIFCRDASSL